MPVTPPERCDGRHEMSVCTEPLGNKFIGKKAC
jgi:hypothetical protein